MKKTILTLATACLVPYMLLAQFKISGKITDNQNGNPLPFAHVSVENTLIVVFSDQNGSYEINNLSKGVYKIKCSFMGYETTVKEINFTGDLICDFNLEQQAILSDEVIIKATRTAAQSPVATTNLTKKDVQKINLGQDLPVLLSSTPSVVVSSDAGAGIGYTGIKIRGSDGTRINVTINGIPVNDSESHGVWWVNMPDLVSSVENLQIQRGVGSSTNGAAAFGATINLLTNALNQENYAELATSVGSFNTMKNTVSFGSGLLKSKWAFDGRVSRITSNGYIDRGKTNLSSYYLSGGYYGKKNIVKLIHFSGKEKTYQAWYGVPKDSLETNPTYNPSGLYYDKDGTIKYYDNETDNYQQDHYQIHYSLLLNRNFTFNSAVHYTYGRGYYEQYKDGDKYSKYELPDVIIGNDTISSTDIIRQRWLDNQFYGTTYALNYNSYSNLTAILGGAYNIYRGNHFGKIIWAEIAKDIPMGQRYYDNDAYKTDLNNFAKLQYSIGKINIFGDIQHRRISYNFLGKAIINTNIENLQQDAVFNFINPKAGLTYELNHQNMLYAFWGIANREPVRDDFIASSSQSRPKHETLNNFELGYKRNAQKYSAGINAYLMNYRNQLVLTGEINDVGDYTRKNIDGSYRAGIEVESEIIFTNYLKWQFNFTYSQNKIKKFTEHYDVYDQNWDWTGTDSITYTNTNISFSPDYIASSNINIIPFKNFNVDVISKYVGKQYIDNTSNAERMLKPYLVNDIKLYYFLSVKKNFTFEFNILINNILDETYITNAWVYNGIVGQMGLTAIEDGYFPQAGRNFLLGLNIKFK